MRCGRHRALAIVIDYGPFGLRVWGQDLDRGLRCADPAQPTGALDSQRIAHFRAYALCVGGWALGVSGESEKGLAQIGQGVDGSGGGHQHILLAWQADALLAVGKPEAALASVAAGLEAVEKTGGAPFEAELYRLRGEAFLAGAGTTASSRASCAPRRDGPHRLVADPQCPSGIDRDDQQCRHRRLLDQHTQRFQRRRIGPVQIFTHHQHRGSFGRFNQPGNAPAREISARQRGNALDRVGQS